MVHRGDAYNSLPMSRRQSIALAVLAVAGAIVVWLARTGRQPPLLPADATHASFTTPAACLACHGPSGVQPRTKRHPLGDDCLRCHGFR